MDKPTGKPLHDGLGNPYDKVMIAPSLESCRHGTPNCPPTAVDDAFLRNAKVNLEEGRKQVKNLEQEQLPGSLEPVRHFLLDNLITTLHMEEARYEYIDTGDVAPLRALLHEYCTGDHPDLFRDLREAPDAETRRELSEESWHNAVWQCYRERSGKYPAQAWKQFVQQYHVRETVTAKPEQ